MTRPPRVEDFVDAAARAGGLAREMVRVDGFVTRVPRDGEAMSESTEVYLGYDARQLYAVFVCFDKEPGRVRAHLAGRDRIPADDDTVAFQVDTFEDQLHAYGFQVNALGVQQDGTWTEGTGWDLSFDTVWRADGRVTDEGYIVVISVPVRSLRFPPGASRSFGLMLFRGIARTNEQGFWPAYSTRLAGRMNQAGKLTRLEGLTPGGAWQVSPYAFARARRTTSGEVGASDARADVEAALGVDAKWVWHDSLTVDLTANPDFSQIESDEPQVTVNQRFEVFFPEKRPFFLENATYFDTPIPLFFSRRIADPVAGGRVSGRVGAYTVGALAARDTAHGGSTSAVVRATRDIGRQSRVGVFASGWTGAAQSNLVSGLDTRLRLGESWTLAAQVAGSSSRTETGIAGHAARAILERSGRRVTYRADVDERSREFASAVGFIDRVDVRRATQTASARWFPRRRLLSWGLDATGTVVADGRGRPLERSAKPGLAFEWPRLTTLSVFEDRGSTRLPMEASRFAQNRHGISLTTSPSGALTVAGSATVGDGLNLTPAASRPAAPARERGWSVSIQVRPTTRASLDVSALGTHVTDASTLVFDDAIVRAKAQWQFTKALSARIIAQRDRLTVNPTMTRLERRSVVTVDALLAWLLSPGTAVYLGVTDDRARTTALATGRQVFVKASYLVRP
ncbi:MAG: DUF5916 domain-containing protein [Vicinamibacterales bacterium]